MPNNLPFTPKNLNELLDILEDKKNSGKANAVEMIELQFELFLSNCNVSSNQLWRHYVLKKYLQSLFTD